MKAKPTTGHDENKLTNLYAGKDRKNKNKEEAANLNKIYCVCINKSTGNYALKLLFELYLT